MGDVKELKQALQLNRDWENNMTPQKKGIQYY
jgi:hypothetical protein